MLVAGKAKFVGFRSGDKNGKVWLNVYLDDLSNLMERSQFFVSDQILQNKIMTQFAPGDTVIVECRMSTRQTASGTAQSVFLTDLYKSDK